MWTTKAKSVLVMDDEPVLRSVFRLMVEACGYKAQVAKDGYEAVEFYRKARECGFPFDAVILDLNNVNGKGGRETIRELRGIDPDVKAIVMSGNVDNPVLTNFREFGFRCALAKPFMLEELKLAIQHVTDEAAVCAGQLL